MNMEPLDEFRAKSELRRRARLSQLPPRPTILDVHQRGMHDSGICAEIAELRATITAAVLKGARTDDPALLAAAEALLGLEEQLEPAEPPHARPHAA
jgi:hypothetical protein